MASFVDPEHPVKSDIVAMMKDLSPMARIYRRARLSQVCLCVAPCVQTTLYVRRSSLNLWDLRRDRRHRVRQILRQDRGIDTCLSFASKHHSRTNTIHALRILRGFGVSYRCERLYTMACIDSAFHRLRCSNR